MKLQEVKALFSELQIQPTKQLGQNFLIDERICKKIVGEALTTHLNQVYEIGPGLGALTRELKMGSYQFTAIELDKKLAHYWRQQGVDLIHQDALKYPWYELVKEDSVIVSNLPYQISSSLVILLSPLWPVKKMVLMLQKEVAERMVAKDGSKDYGLLSIISQTYWQMHKLLDVPAKAFFPPPKVESRVLVFQRKENIKFKEPDFTQFVKLAFSQRRKLLCNNLKAYSEGERTVEEVFAQMGIDKKVRAEQLSVETFQRLFLELNHGN